MVDFINTNKIQDKLAQYTILPCISCGEMTIPMYVIYLKGKQGENYLPLCVKCRDQLKLAIDLESIDD